MSPFTELADRVPVLIPGVGLAIGVALLGWGGTLWRFTQIVAGLGLGALLGFELGEFLHNEQVGWGAAITLGLGFAVGFYLIERAAFAGLGALATVAAVGLAWPLVQHAEPSMQVRGIAAAVGLLLGALLHARALQLTTAIVGAALVAWAFKQEGNALIIGPLAGLGAAWQFGVGRGGGKGGGKGKKRG